MARIGRFRLRAWLEVLLHVHDTPERTALAFALGVFFGFSPFLGLHTLLGLVAAFAFRLNRVAMLLGVYTNLPWIIVPYYATATALAAALSGSPMPADAAHAIEIIAADVPLRERLHGATTLARPFLWPFVLGSTAGAIALAAVAYRTAVVFLRRRRRQP